MRAMKVLVQEDVEQIKITLALNGIDTWMITTTMLKSTILFEH
jgi:hypothetical protein